MTLFTTNAMGKAKSTIFSNWHDILAYECAFARKQGNPRVYASPSSFRSLLSSACYSTRSVSYRQLRNPFPAYAPYSLEYVEQIHSAALDILDGQGLKIWLPEARDLLAAQGARVEGEMVFFSPKIG